jgi:hypothetical protein
MERDIKILFKILYYDEDVIVAEKDGEKIIFYPYCSCNSGFWFLYTEKLSKDSFNSLPTKLQEKLRELGFAP